MEKSIKCPNCGCVWVPVAYTRHRKGKVIRRRDCVDCGYKLMTQETPIKDEKPQTKPQPWWIT